MTGDRNAVVRLCAFAFLTDQRRRFGEASIQCCAICRLRHDELLEAAHILPDGHPLGERRSFPTAWRSASSTTPPSTATSSASRPTSQSPCASTSSRRWTGRCSRMAPRASRAGASTCRAPITSSPIATLWPSATPSSAAPADRLYPFGHVDTKIPRGVVSRHGLATSRGDHDALPHPGRNGTRPRRLPQAVPRDQGHGDRVSGASWK
jgi:hypothetical protein